MSMGRTKLLIIATLTLCASVAQAVFSGTFTTADYTVWRNNFGSTINLAADGDGNGVVDAGDYVIYRKKFGATSGSGAGDLGETSVPEPSSGLLILSVMLVFNAVSRRRPARTMGNQCV
jgi:hypothetical protein